ncbi:MAG: sulfatase [Lachnospiraceae bacterium]|nr:sulfatase [Lachnospiraceae bacterium]
MRQNLLYIFADQWRYQALGAHGEDQVRTPNMDRFAAESVDFGHAYSTFPLCSPHRASLMTGKYPFSVGMWTNCKTGLEEKIMLKPQETCIGNVLKEYGYQTGYIGKWHLDASEQNFDPAPKSGAREWDAYTPPGERRAGFDYWLSYGACDEHLAPHYWQDDERQIRPGKWSAEFETDKAIEFMEKRKADEAPFALFVSYNPPHLPYELVPEKYDREFRDLEVVWRANVPQQMRGEPLLSQTRHYFAAVTGIDEQFGRILSFLERAGLEENTLVVLSADHGDMLGSQGLMSKNVWYEESIHIPLLMRQKGRLEPGEYREIFASPDHMPTLLGLLGIRPPAVCQGYDHSGMILNKEGTNESESPPQEMFLCSYPGSEALVSCFARAGLTHKAYGWRGIKTREYTYVLHNGYRPGEEQREWLYHDEEDKYQLSPRRIDADCQDEEILHFRKKLWEYLALTQDPFLWQERNPQK